MRTSPPKQTLEARIAKRYHRLYKPLVELVQSIQDLQTDGIQGAEIELTRSGGEIEIQYAARATKLTINDEGRRFVLVVEKGLKKK